MLIRMNYGINKGMVDDMEFGLEVNIACGLFDDI